MEKFMRKETKIGIVILVIGSIALGYGVYRSGLLSEKQTVPSCAVVLKDINEGQTISDEDKSYINEYMEASGRCVNV